GSSDAPAKEEAPAEEPAAEEEESASEESAPAASGDATDVEMPELGESVTEGTITQWLKSVGDTVEVDEPLLEVSTDKVDTEIPSPVAGTLVEILADEDDTIDVAAAIARIGDGNAKPAASEKKEEPKPEPKEEAPAKEEPAAEEAAPAASSDSASGDANEVELPELGDSVTEVPITPWLTSFPYTTHVRSPLLEVSTDKVDTEIPSPVAGTL